MPGGGVSLPTTIAQMGAVAKTQARGQATQQAHPADQRRQEQDEFKVERVKETEQGEKTRVDPEDSRRDKRRQRRLRRREKQRTAKQAEQNPATEFDEGTGEEREAIGSLIDCRV